MLYSLLSFLYVLHIMRVDNRRSASVKGRSIKAIEAFSFFPSPLKRGIFSFFSKKVEQEGLSLQQTLDRKDAQGGGGQHITPIKICQYNRNLTPT